MYVNYIAQQLHNECRPKYLITYEDKVKYLVSISIANYRIAL